jgi:ATP-dependent RNA helicase SUPV3L1/SUV3
MQIINSGSDKKNEIKLIPEMLNLLGCSKENFKKLIQNMNYKIIEKDQDTFFKYTPQKKNKKSFKKAVNKENPFGVLKNLNLR